MAASRPEAWSDEKLVKQCKRKPVREEAWMEFWRRYHPFVRRKISNIVSRFRKQPNPPEVDDVVQLVFLKIFDGLHTYDPGTSPLFAFISVVTTNAVIDQLRHSKLADGFEPLEDTDAICHAVQVGEIETEQLWDAVARTLEAIDQRKRASIQAYLLGESTAEICKRFAITRSCLQTRVSRFRERIRRTISSLETAKPPV
jgi:RNA polymerase sigma factor (sigma-70 family)